MKTFAVLTSLGFAAINVALTQPAPSKLVADLILLNAVVRTMETNHPLAQAVAMTGNRIAAVGTTQDSSR